MKNISERISQIVAEAPEGRPKVDVRPERAAEELWALWREFRSLSPKKEKSEIEQARQKTLFLAMAERWRNPAVCEIVSKTLRQECLEREKIALVGLEYNQIRDRRDSNETRRSALFKQIFKSDGSDVGELEEIELAELQTKIEVDNQIMERVEKFNPELAARLSYERLRRYQRELTNGFIWTPSRHCYFNEFLHRAVVLNQNRPILMYGESGTGKTRLIREIAKRLTNRPPFEVGEEAKDNIRPLLGVKKIDSQGNYIIFGPLGRALIGKQTSRDQTAGPGGVFYMDEMNGYPPDALRSLIKQISGRKSGETVSFAAWEGQEEKIASGFMFVGSANLLSEKHPDRPDLPNELKRELAPSSFEVDYPPQTPENPEFFEMCLAALMDKNGRVRAQTWEIGAEYLETVDSGKNLKIFSLNTDKKSGGALWRFAQMAAEIQRCYKMTKGAERIDGAPFDPGVALAWLAEYRKSTGRRGESLQNFLAKKLDQWIGNEGGQKLFSAPDIKRLREICKDFGLSITDISDKLVENKNLTSLEIGRLSPRVPRPPEIIRNEISPEENVVYTESGEKIEYKKTAVADVFYPNAVWLEKDGGEKRFIFLGKTKDERLVFSDPSNLAILFTLQEAKNRLEKNQEPVSEFISGQLKRLQSEYSARFTEFKIVVPNLTTLESPPNLTEAHLECFNEVFGAGNLEFSVMPSEDQLTPEYFRAMYPETQRPEDTARGLKSFSPSWFKQAANVNVVGPANETWFQAYLRSLKATARKYQGSLILTESVKKPDYNDGQQQYTTKEGTPDPLIPLLKKVFGETQTHRFSLTHDQWTTQLIPRLKEKITQKLTAKGLTIPNFKIILTPATISNQQTTLNHPENSQTNTNEWSDDILLKQDGTDSGRRLTVGNSGNGGAGFCVNRDPRGRDSNRRGGRLSVVFLKS